MKRKNQIVSKKIEIITLNNIINNKKTKFCNLKFFTIHYFFDAEDSLQNDLNFVMLNVLKSINFKDNRFYAQLRMSNANMIYSTLYSSYIKKTV